MEPGFFRNVTVAGLGLMGGSFCLAARRAHPDVRLTGVDEPEVLRGALGYGMIRRGLPPSLLEAAVADADLVVLAAPVKGILGLLGRLSGRVRPGTVVTDTGSTKMEICRAARTVLWDGAAFVGGHPLCGSERRGIGAADAGLFRGAAWVLTPPAPPVAPAAFRALARFVEALGARVRVLDAEEHDRIVATTSHLPQLLAVALAVVAGRRDGSPGCAGRGLRDMTRLAGSSFEVWADILSTNPARIDEALGEAMAELGRIRRMLRQGDFRAMATLFREAAQVRARFASPPGRESSGE
jgi:prephenate dehydrogenase